MKSASVAAVVALLIASTAAVSFYAGLGASSGKTVTETSTSTVTATLTSSGTVGGSTVTSTETVAAGSGQLGPWNATTPYPGSYLPSSCVTASGYIYCVGGNGNSTFFATIAQGEIGGWARTTDYPLPVETEGCVASSGNIYCIGGVTTAQTADPYGRIAAVYYATLSSAGIGAWEQTTSFPHVAPYPRCMTFESQVYCVEASFNGTSFSNPGQTFVASLSQGGVGTWVEAAGPASMTAGCSMVDGYVYCYGGGSCSPSGPVGDCFSQSYAAPLSASGVGVWNSTTQLPTATFDVYVAAESYIYYLGTPIFFAPVSGVSIGQWETTTNFPDSFSPGACAPSGPQIYCVGGNGTASYVASVGAQNQSVLAPLNPPPFARALYLVGLASGTPGCRSSYSGGACFGPNIADAVVFDCAVAAATSTGCNATVGLPASPSVEYPITIWYPDANATSPNSNCEFLLPSSNYGHPFDAWCISVSQTSFIIAQEINMQAAQP